jgi:hypothetical protein
LAGNLKEQIQDAAYYIWLNRGRPEGCDFDIWQEAEQYYWRKKIRGRIKQL